MKKDNIPIREGERRLATILFADLSGFTSMSEKMDPEELTVIVNECLQIMGSCIRENEGTIDKFMGDCVMALFGVPSTIENAPSKAIKAAIEIRTKINQFGNSQNIKHPLDIHIGINTGRVIAGPIGSDETPDYTVMGDAVNIASRLKDISEAGQIFVGPETYRFTKKTFAFKTYDSVTIRGKDDKIPVYELLPEKETGKKEKWHSDRIIFSELVGRHAELDKLSLYLLKVINGEGSIVNVVGEPGIGKSRLMAELRTKEEMSRVRYLEGKAISSGKNLSFFPIVEILKKWAEIKEDDEEISHKLEKRIREIAAEEVLEIYPFIATLMGLKLSGKYAERIHEIEGAALEKLILKNLNTLLVKMSAEKPLVLVLEDLHWSDISSIEMLESICRLAENHPILFINVFRPGYKETSERILDTTRARYSDHSNTIVLEPLSESNAEKLINNLIRIKGMPVKIKEQIIYRTSGNPFFIEEIIRSLIDEGLIRVKNNTFEVTRQIESVVIPGTINEVIMSRIDRLDENSRTLLKIASVIGRSFYYKILSNMTDIHEEMDTRLSYMEEMQLIAREHKKEEIAYLFKHALAQEATYESILLKKRKELHLQTALTIEKIFAEKISEFYGILAWHFSKGEDFIKAEEYLIKAGEEALQTSASSEAINYFSDALEIYRTKFDKEADPQRIAEMEKNIGKALVNKGQFAEAIPYLENVLKYYGIKSRRNKAGTVLTILSGFIHLLIGLYFPSLKWRKKPTAREEELNTLRFLHHEAIAFSDSSRIAFTSFQIIKKLTSIDISRSTSGLSQFLMITLHFSYVGISFTLHRKILNFIKKDIKSQKIPEQMLYDFGVKVNQRMEGNYASYDYKEDLIENSIKTGNLQYLSFLIIFSFFIELGMGKFKEANRKIDKLKELGSFFDNYTIQGWVFMTQSKLLTKQKKWQEALIQIDKFIEFLKKVNDVTQLLWGFASKAYIQFHIGDIRGAEDSMQQVSQHQSTDILYVFKTTLKVTQLRINIYYLEKAIQSGNQQQTAIWKRKTGISVKQSYKVSKKIADDRVEILKLIGTYYWITGKRKKALKWWDKSIREGERLGALPELARTYAEAAGRLSENPSKYNKVNGMTTDKCYEKAEEIFSNLDLENDLMELKKNLPEKKKVQSSLAD